MFADVSEHRSRKAASYRQSGVCYTIVNRTTCERAGKSGKQIERCAISSFQIAARMGFKGNFRAWETCCGFMSKRAASPDFAMCATRRRSTFILDFRNYAHARCFQHFRRSCSRCFCRKGDSPEFSHLRHCRLPSF